MQLEKSLGVLRKMRRISSPQKALKAQAQAGDV